MSRYTGPRCACGGVPSHTITQHGATAHQCCACYVAEGNPPADWHIGCMRPWTPIVPVFAPDGSDVVVQFVPVTHAMLEGT